LDALDSPLSIRMAIEMPNFARPVAGSLVLAPPFVWQVGRLATLPERQTPLLITAASHQSVHLTIEFPRGAKLLSTLARGKISNGDRYVLIEDSLRARTLVLKRTVHLPAGRIQPAQYPDFVQFAQRADDAQNSSVRIGVGK
jgi:hypothetical protein